MPHEVRHPITGWPHDQGINLMGRDQQEHGLPADCLIYADEQRLQQVFVNLIKNAFDAGSK